MKVIFRSITIAFVLFAAMSTAFADSAMEGGKVTVKSGVASKIYGIGYCDRPSYSTVSAFAEHGKVTSREIKAKLCNQTDFPVTQAIYTSEPGFVGVDNVTLYLNDRTLAITVMVVK